MVRLLRGGIVAVAWAFVLIGPGNLAPPDQADRFIEEGRAHHTAGRYTDAEKILLRALEHCESQRGLDDIKTGDVRRWLGILYRDMGWYERAEPMFRRALEIYERKLDVRDPRVGRTLSDWAIFCGLVGQDEQAAALASRSVRIWEGQPRYLADRAFALNVLGMAAFRLKQTNRAEECFRSSLRALEKGPGAEHLLAPSVWANLAWLYQSRQDYAQAEGMYREALRLLEKLAPQGHSRIARCIANLGWLAHARGRLEEAERYQRRALAVREAHLYTDHPDLALSLNSLAGVRAARGDWDEAIALTDRGSHILRRHVAHVLPAMSELDQLAFLRTHYRPELQGALSLGLARRNDLRAVHASSGWILNSKGLAIQSLAERALLGRDRSSDAKAQELVTLLERVRAESRRASPTIFSA